MNAPNFIGRFDHYCGKVRAIYTLRDGGTSQTGWFDSEATAANDIPVGDRVDSKNQFPAVSA